MDNLNKIKSKEDLLSVIKKFGVKPYGIYGLASQLTTSIGLSSGLDLAGWLREALPNNIIDNTIGGNPIGKVKAVWDKFGVPF